MFLLKFIPLLSCLMVCVTFCAGQSVSILEAIDCNCDVDIEIVKLVLDKLEKLEKRVEEINSRKVHTHAEIAKPQSRVPINCLEAAAGTLKSGVYQIQVGRFSEKPFNVWCDEDTDFGGWTVIQRRVSAAVDFYRNWTDYKNGFGNLADNYWIGLDKLHALTTSCEHELYIKMQTFGGETYYAKYTNFVVGSEAEGYLLRNVCGYKGNASDYFENHQGNKFTTHDRDNDQKDDDNCAKKWRGGWWYRSCYWSNLNGDYTQEKNGQGIVWIGINRNESLKFVQMMIRPTETCMKRLSFRY